MKYLRNKVYTNAPPVRNDFSGKAGLKVVVLDNNIDGALKVLKKRMQQGGSFREMKRKLAYEKPSEKKSREKEESIRRQRKLARKKAEREGLTPKYF